MDLLHVGGEDRPGKQGALPLVSVLFFVWCMCVFSPEGLCQINVCKSIVDFCQFFIDCIFMSQQEVRMR